MKKLILGMCAALAVIGVSCSKGNDGSDKNLPKGLCDSISMYSGASIGGYVLSDYLNYTRTAESEISKDDIIKGIQLVFANADTEGSVVGLQIGAQLVNQILRYEKDGIKIDRNVLLNNFRHVFDADTLDMEALALNNGKLTELLNRAQKIREAIEEEAKQEELSAALNSGSEYINTLKAEDPEIKTSESGLSYRIINPGEEPRVQDNSSIEVNYVGRLTDGTVFDQTQGTPATFSPSGVIPGFAEGLKLLGKGGKAVLYIPGDLAYGANGVPQAGIGPNAMLIFDVEVVDVHNPEDAE